MARFEAASGKAIDSEEFPMRKDALINELTLAQYSEAQARAAEPWILRGNPVRYGSLTLADFFPTPEQLEQIGYNLAAEFARAERQADARGYDRGFRTAEVRQREEQAAAAPRKILEEDERLELEYLRGLCDALTSEMDRYKADDVRAARLQGIKRKFEDQFDRGAR